MSQQGTTHPSPLIIESMATAMWENVTGPLFENGLRPKGSTWDCVRCQTRSKLTATNTQHPVHFYFVEAKHLNLAAKQIRILASSRVYSYNQ